MRNERFVIEDFRLCSSECGKTHCVRNKKNRMRYHTAYDLKDERGGHCANFLPKFKVSIPLKRDTFHCDKITK